MKKLFSAVFAALCLCLSLALLCSCGGKQESDKEQNTQYRITAQSDGCTFAGLPAQAKEGETISFSATAENNLQTIDKILAGETECARDTNGTYSFTMPAKDVSLQAVLSWRQEEILKDDVLSWRGNTPSQVCKAQEADADWARQIVYFDFSSPRNVASGGKVTLTSLNPDIIPQSALSEPYLHKSDTANGFCDYGSFEISLGDVSVGTAYIALRAETSSGTPIDATIIKKIEVVEYGNLTEETWTERVEVDLSAVYEQYASQGLKIQISDQDQQYGATLKTVTSSVTADVMTVFIEYVPTHSYAVTVYCGEIPQLTFFSLTECVMESASYLDGALLFTRENALISVSVLKD